MLEPVVARYRGKVARLYFRADAAGVVQVRVTPKTKNPFTIKALSISGVT